MREGPFQLGLANDTVCEAVPDRTAIVQGDRRLTYAELGRRSRQVAHLMRSRDLGCWAEPETVDPWLTGQDHVAVLSMNRPEFMEAYHGAYKARTAPFNVNYRYTPDEITWLLRNAAATAVVYEAKFAPLLASVLPHLDKEMKLLLQIDDGSGEGLDQTVDYEEAIAEQPSDPLDLPYSGNEVMMIYTGGTTGMPKGVLWEHEQLFMHTLTGQLPGEPRPQNHAELAERVRSLDPPGAMMVCPPCMHGAGLWSSHITLNQGGKVVYSPVPETLDADAILRACEQEAVTMMGITGDAFAVPIVDALREGDYNLSSLFAISTQAVALTPNTRKALHELLPNVMIIESYGTTEGGFQGIRMGSAADTDIAEALKFERVNDTVVVDEEHTRVLSPDEVEVIGWTARSGKLPRGYYNDPEKTQETFLEIGGTRYSVSGDRAYYRPDGTIQFLGREAVCINTGGEKVFGEEVESALKSHPAVRDAIVLGTPDPRFGERVTAVLGLREEATDADLQEHCRATLAGYKIPRTIVRVDEVPRLANGKPDYARAKEAAMAEVDT